MKITKEYRIIAKTLKLVLIMIGGMEETTFKTEKEACEACKREIIIDIFLEFDKENMIKTLKELNRIVEN